MGKGGSIVLTTSFLNALGASGLCSLGVDPGEPLRPQRLAGSRRARDGPMNSRPGPWLWLIG